jgi:hypothetical protein
MRFTVNEIKGRFPTEAKTTGVFLPAVLLFLPFFVFRVSWGIDNQFISLYLHIPQAITIAAICAVSFAQLRANTGQAVVIIIFSGLLLIHLTQAIVLSSSLAEYSRDYFLQGILLWAYLFVVCVYASIMKVKTYPRLLHFFDLFAKGAVLGATAFYLLYQLTGIAVLVHFYEGFGVSRLEGFFSEPSAFAPVSCWLMLSGIRYKKATSVGLAMVVCVLAFSPIVIICTLLALITYLMIFRPRLTPLILILGGVVVVWGTAFDCSIPSEGSTLSRAVCGVNSIFSEDTRAVFSNDRILSSIAIVEHISATDSWAHGLGLNSTSVFMPAYFGVMRDNSLPISLIAFYGIPGGIALVAFAAFGLLKAWQNKNDFSIFWLSFFWCSMINSAQGFITYTLLFVASIWLLRCADQKQRQ